MSELGVAILVAVGLLILWILRHTLGALSGMGLGRKVAAALEAKEPRPFAVLRGRPPKQRADALWEVLPPYLLDDDYDTARMIVREMETADPHLATLGAYRIAEGEADDLAAERAARRLVEFHEHNVHYRAILAELLLKRGALDEAAALLQAGDQSDPVLAGVMIEVLRARGEHERADQLEADTLESLRQIELQKQHIV